MPVVCCGWWLRGAPTKLQALPTGFGVNFPSIMTKLKPRLSCVTRGARERYGGSIEISPRDVSFQYMAVGIDNAHAKLLA